MGEKITVKLFATLARNYAVPDEIDLNSQRKISDILRDIGIPQEKVTIIFINGRHADHEDLVRPGQVLALFPPLGGG